MQIDNPTRREMIRILALASAAAALPAATAFAADPSDPTPANKTGSEQIAILVYPEFTALDALGPHFALSGMTGATVRFVAKTKDVVPCEGAAAGGFCVKPHLSFADCPKNLDLLLVPGGMKGTIAAIADEETRNFIADRGAKAKLAGSVCTGSLLLGAAGLLKGKQATSHWAALKVLSDVGATPIAERIVFDGDDRVTAAGVSAGLDLGFELVRRYRGDFQAKGVQLLGEYDPHPPFPRAGNATTADKDVVEMLNQKYGGIVEKFRAEIKKARAAGGW